MNVFNYKYALVGLVMIRISKVINFVNAASTLLFALPILFSELALDLPLIICLTA